MPVKKFGEREAWEKLAKEFDARTCVFICHGIAALPDELHAPMRERLYANKPNNQRTREGHIAFWRMEEYESRAAFCRKMARLCRPKKR